MPRGPKKDKRHAVNMRVEHNVPVVPADFGQADLLDAESEVIEFILRFFGSAHRVLPVLTALAGGFRGGRPALPVLTTLEPLAGSTSAPRGVNAGRCEGEQGEGQAVGHASGTGTALPTVLEPTADSHGQVESNEAGATAEAPEPSGGPLEAEARGEESLPPPAPIPKRHRKAQGLEREGRRCDSGPVIRAQRRRDRGNKYAGGAFGEHVTCDMCVVSAKREVEAINAGEGLGLLGQ
eukprot:3212203-Alexandrium_andersonii.AAC.1